MNCTPAGAGRLAPAVSFVSGHWRLAFPRCILCRAMKRVLAIFLLGFTTATGVFAAFRYHFILTSQGFVVERKSELALEDTFIDARRWGFIDYLKHPHIAGILARNSAKGLLDAADDAVDRAAQTSKAAIEKSRKALGDGLEKAGRKVRP